MMNDATRSRMGRHLTPDEARAMQKKSAESRCKFSRVREELSKALAETDTRGKTKLEKLVGVVMKEALKGDVRFIELVFRVLGMNDKNQDENENNTLYVEFIESGIKPAHSEQEVIEREHLQEYYN
jgi:hypothetical protein